MASIDYTHILNAYVSTEGSNGFMTNYIYYSVLVVYTNGSREIVEGNNSQIAHLLPFLRTPQDSLSIIEQSVIRLRNDISDIIDQKMDYVINSLFPIPPLEKVNEPEAVAMLQKAGLKPSFIRDYPPSTPANGYVRSYHRNAKDFKTVDLDIIHALPNVTGMQKEEAVSILEQAGFTVQVQFQSVSDMESNQVLSCSRNTEESMNAVLTVSAYTPSLIGLTLEEAKEMLTSHGLRYEYERKFSSSPIDTVIESRSLAVGVVKLFISKGREKYSCPNVNMTWEGLNDSDRNVLKASATFTLAHKVLHFTLNYFCAVKTKHKITGIVANINGNQIQGYIDPTHSFTIDAAHDTLTSRFTLPSADLPTFAVIQLETQYGLIKKFDTLTLNCTFSWD